MNVCIQYEDSIAGVMQLPLSYYDILDKTNKYVFIISINFSP